MKNANSTEIDASCDSPVVIDMPEHNQGRLGGTMRLGRRATLFQPGVSSILSKMELCTTLIK